MEAREYVEQTLASCLMEGERIKQGVIERIAKTLEGVPESDWDIWGLVGDDDFESIPAEERLLPAQDAGEKAAAEAIVRKWTDEGRGQFR